MAIDASIPLQVKQFSLADIMMNAEKLATAQQDREYQKQKMDLELQDARQKGAARRAFSAYLMGGDASGVLPNQTGASQSYPALGVGSAPNDPTKPGTLSDLMQQYPALGVGQPGGNTAAPDPWRAYAAIDPEGALKARGDRVKVTKDEYQLHKDLNDGAMQILGGVTDQASYAAGKQQARDLYARYGFNIDELNLPEDYTPGTINRLRMQAMRTDRQLAAVRDQNRLDWDMEDDRLDNERADRNTDSMISDRNARRGLTARGQNMASSDRRRGQDMTDKRERERPRNTRSSGYGSGNAGSGYTQTATDPNTGKKVGWNGKSWVPIN